MQFRILPAGLLFLGSYFPLSVILALQDIKLSIWGGPLWKQCIAHKYMIFEHPYLSIIGILGTGLCFFITIYLLQHIRYKYPITVVEAKSIPSELIGYSFPYIVSFMGVDYASLGKIAGLAAFLFWLFIITYRAGQIIMNPLLLVFGWNLYEAKITIGSQQRIVRILSNQKLVPGNYLSEEIQQNYICKKGE
ncbi:hypothetical protein [Geothrix sp. 21YS21S-4]|uniref:hypothetical protein n=1 Tax=Geothrix sp. 21YS21S-4 TaxID=3068889 RepID=UPI0027B935E0|nr:hypothetical protein [Geothrix sp. 21YS21S-4]